MEDTTDGTTIWENIKQSIPSGRSCCIAIHPQKDRDTLHIEQWKQQPEGKSSPETKGKNSQLCSLCQSHEGNFLAFQHSLGKQRQQPFCSSPGKPKQ